MSLPGVYLDEDAQSWALIETLKARGLVLVTTTEAVMSNRTDEEQLRFALTQRPGTSYVQRSGLRPASL